MSSYDGVDDPTRSASERAWETKHDRELRFGIGWEMRQMLIEMSPAEMRVVVEIGTFQGDSLRIWREVLDPDLLIGVQDTDETTPETAREVGAVLIKGKSQDAETYDRVRAALGHDVAGWCPRGVDLLYVDGDHMYPSVKRDWELYSPLVRSGGIIVLHDAVIENNDSVEVYRFYREVRIGRRTKLIYAGLGSTGTAMVFV